MAGLDQVHPVGTVGHQDTLPVFATRPIKALYLDQCRTALGPFPSLRLPVLALLGMKACRDHFPWHTLECRRQSNVNLTLGDLTPSEYYRHLWLPAELRYGGVRNTSLSPALNRVLSEVSPLILQHLGNDLMTLIQKAAARDKKTPVDLLVQLAMSPKKSVRKEALLNESICHADLKNLLPYLDIDGLRYLSQNKNAPSVILGKLLNDPDQDFDVRLLVLKNPNIALADLIYFSNSLIENFRCAVACNEATPGEVLLAFFLKPEEAVRVKHAALKNPGFPPNAWCLVSQHPNKILRAVAACATTLSRVVQEQLCEDPHASVRAKLALNTSVLPFVFDRLAADKSTDVRFNVAKNEATPSTVLMTMRSDFDEFVREEAEANLLSRSP